MTRQRIHRVECEVALAALDSREIPRSHAELLSQRFLSQPTSTTELAHLRAENRLERSGHSSSVPGGIDHFQVVIASSSLDWHELRVES